jgi:PilZ domain-containing protein
MSEPQEHDPAEEAESERRSVSRTKSRVERTVVATLTDTTYGALTTHLYILDISPNGMRINLDRTMEPESEFELSFGLESLGFGLSGQLGLICEVVWNRPLVGGTCILGLKFREPNEASMDAVEQLLGYWSNKHDFQLHLLREPVDAKIRTCVEEPWSRMVGVRKLSVEGFSFPTRKSFESDQEILVRMLLESGTLESKAVIRWCETMESGVKSVGCEFLELSSSGKGFIELHLRRKS